jgi:hypothetical protein
MLMLLDPRQVRTGVPKDQGISGSRSYGYGTRGAKEQGEAGENPD